MAYITGSYDCDTEIIKYMDLEDIINLALVNNILYKLVTGTKIYSEIIQLKNTNKKDILKNCYIKGLINILQHYHFNRKTVVIGDALIMDDAIHYASANGHVNILEWFKNSGYKFKIIVYAIALASQNGHVAVLESK